MVKQIQALKQGYQKTEIGVIPEDWGVKELSELTSLMTNGFVGVAKIHYTNADDGILYIQGFNVEENSFNFRGIKKVTSEFHKQHLRSSLEEGDLLTVQTGDIGLTTIVPKELVGSNCHALIITRFKKKKSCPKFFSYYFNSFNGRNRLRIIETGTTMKHINVGDMIHFEVPIPQNIQEQEAIARVLSDTDTLIESLNKLITKKKNIKQGAMQELLMGKKRLAGFNGKWEEKTLGEIAEIIKGRGLSKTKLDLEGENKCILYGELFTTYNQVIKKIVNRTHYKEGIPSKEGDVLMPGSTTTVGIDLATASALLKSNVLLGGDVIIIRQKNKSYNAEFLANYLTHIKKHSIAEVTQGITIIHLYGKSLKALSLNIPSNPKEQTAIAQVLSDMDLEIENLEQKRDKYLMLKKGMMQQLLTGRIRLNYE